MKKMILKFNRDFLEFKKDQEITIKCDDQNTPLEKRFRKLLRDVKIEEELIENSKSDEKPVVSILKSLTKKLKPLAENKANDAS